MDMHKRLIDHADEARSELPEARRSERATEHHLVQPFIRDVLGYSDKEVTPQPEVPVGSTTVKCDFAITWGGEHAILIECKKVGVPLDKPGQLATYLEKDQTPVVGIYTDGIKYEIYGVHVANSIKRMDSKPLLSFDLQQDDSLHGAAEGLSHLAKDSFNPDGLREWGTSRQTAQRIQDELRKELQSPSDNFVRMLMTKLDTGVRTRVRVEQFRKRMIEAAAQLLSNGWEASPPSDPLPTSPSTQKIRCRFQGKEYYATLLPSGRVRLDDGNDYPPSPAFNKATDSTGSRNGWNVWQFHDEQTHSWRPINDLPNANEMKRGAKQPGSS